MKNTGKHIILTWVLIVGSLQSLIAQEIDVGWTSNLQTFRSLILPRNENQLETDESRVRFNAAWMNIWSLQDERFLIDGEEFRLSATMRKQLSKDHQIGVQLSLVHQTGGSMDSFIESFHRGVGVSQGQRDLYPRNKLSLSYEPYGSWYPLFDSYPGETLLRRFNKREYPRRGRDQPIDFSQNTQLKNLFENYLLRTFFPSQEVVVIDENSRSGIGDPRLFWQSQVFEKNSWIESVHLGLEVKIPVHGGTMIGSPGLDGSFSITSKFRYSPSLGFSFGASWTAFTERHFDFIRLPKDQFVLRPALIWRDGDWEYFLEYLYFSKPATGFGELSKTGHQIAIGGRTQISTGTLSISIVENMHNYGITPDVSFNIGHEWQL